MAADTITCPFCGRIATIDNEMAVHDLASYRNCACREYSMRPQEPNTSLESYDSETRKRVAALLVERAIKGRPSPWLQFPEPAWPYEDVPYTVPLNLADLLAMWPGSVAERVDRCFCNLIVQFEAEKRLGQTIELSITRPADFLFFTDDEKEERFVVRALIDYGFVTNDKGHMAAWGLEITPTGWAHYEELRQGAENAQNPVFVAMWFGGKDRSKDMEELYDESIKAAVRAAGFRVMRSDKVEHNDFIMGRIIEDIRRAPFLIAELTENNQGVYFEAGFARGLGLDVIYCCPKRVKPHFDVSAVNHVKWSDSDDLRRRLEHRILGTIGRGPHEFEETGVVRTD